ncbi:ead/Ea22-like family protein [Klebsiella pneumoniae]|uniref:ead/Ea22-like family protein n=1 Tax=Klebsiella pneumoniae TaxID=573 RepID=UPI0010DCAE41|nr:ead/Ea22-like family protein [Klebsiella pneumoniae]VGH28331.1 phage EaA protein [Klebsiella pneumoniae]
MIDITKLTAEKLEEIRQRYRPTLAPKCHICGVEMTIQRMSASRITYSCAGAIYDETGCHYAEGRSLADDHYAESRITVVDVSDPDVLAMVEALEKAQQRIDELENDEVRQRLANAEHQLYMAELAKHNLKASRKAQFRKRRAAEKRIAELEAQNEYIRKRYQQLDLLIGKNILVMQAAIIEWQATGDAKNGLAWIYNTLFGPGELPDEAEKDAQAYFDRKYAPLDEELMVLHKWFWEQSEAERAAAGIKVEAE